MKQMIGFAFGWRLEVIDGCFATVNYDGAVLAKMPKRTDAATLAGWLSDCMRNRNFDATIYTLSKKEMVEVTRHIGCRTRSFSSRGEGSDVIWATLDDAMEPGSGPK